MNILRKIEQQKQKLEQLEQALASEIQAEKVANNSLQAFIQDILNNATELQNALQGTQAEKTLAKMIKGVAKYVAIND